MSSATFTSSSSFNRPSVNKLPYQKDIVHTILKYSSFLLTIIPFLFSIINN